MMDLLLNGVGYFIGAFIGGIIVYNWGYRDGKKANNK